MRCFIAVDIDENLKEKIVNLQKEIANYDVKLVESQNLHFTLKFLGEVSDTSNVEAKLQEIAQSFKPFDITIRAAGSFPSLTYIRVVWLSAPELFNLQKTVNELVEEGKSDKEIKPHLTIARVKSPRYRKELMDFIKRNVDTDIGSMTVDKIKLKKSTLTLRGPIYEDVKVFELSS